MPPTLSDTWQPLTFEGRTIYLNPARPDWLVAGPEAQRLLATAPATPREALARAQLDLQLANRATPAYRGRSAHLQLAGLKECWFHLTSRCNLSCRHCLFSCSPATRQELAPAVLEAGLREARALGSRLIYFTGGEPLLYPDFPRILKNLLADPALHVVVLTNGLLLGQHRAELSALPRERLHFQISLDGLEEHHDQLRGPATFRQLLASLDTLREEGFLLTLSVAVNRVNLADLAEIVNLAADRGVANLHFLWHFIRGQGSTAQFVEPAEIFPQLRRAQEIAAARGISIDNIETIRSRVFSAPGTRFDLSNTGWESLAVGPDGNIYPSPALVGVAELNCGPLTEGLEQAWRQSPILARIRASSWLDWPATAARPLNFLSGGGDIDHSYLGSGEFTGHDPYLELYEAIALWLISEQAARYPVPNPGEIILRMGDVRHDCPDGGRAVSLTHCNCVVALSGSSGHRAVQEFYGQAALQTNADIVNPFGPQAPGLAFIPLDSQKRSYGCGSPVEDASLKPDEVLVDLGSGSGVECFLAAAQVGRSGRVFGIDMTPEMLALARNSQISVAAKLGYDNVEFRQGFLEAIPLPDGTADVVISNCVINLSPDKRTTFHEIHRVLKPGGRLVVSDIVTDRAIPVSIKNNLKFRGECLGGALQQVQLLAMLRATGFTGARLLKRFPYRLEGSTQFFSLTYSCIKTEDNQEMIEVIYRGPAAVLSDESGVLFFKGHPVRVTASLAKELGDDFFILDTQGRVMNQSAANACGCGQEMAAPALTGSGGPTSPAPPPLITGVPMAISTFPGSEVPSLRTPRTKHHQGCLVCGGPVDYLPRPLQATCHFCGLRTATETTCPEHFICDTCHLEDGVAVIKHICGNSREKDLFSLLHLLRSHPALAMHGPEHHALVPGVILACYRNNGGKLNPGAIANGIDRGSKVPGGVCGFWGGCGAGLGVGIAFAVIMESTPMTPKARQQSQEITARVMRRLSETKAARCCRRESLTALREAAAIAEENLGLTMPARDYRACAQSEANRECIRKGCPFWEGLV